LTRIGIVAALPAEAHSLGPRSGARRGLASLADGTLLVVSGIGGVAAAQAAEALVTAGATALVSWGVAGGLDPALRAGTILLPAEVVSSEGVPHPTAHEWRERVRVALVAQRPQSGGRLLSSARIIETAAEKSAAFHRTGAAAVDMESLAIAEVAAARGVPFLAVRVIIDTATDVLPRAVTAASHSGRVQIWRLLRAIVVAPRDLAGLFRLARRYAAARRSLAAVARSGWRACAP
jgi:adenosylhomocysteine nucleosidase